MTDASPAPAPGGLRRPTVVSAGVGVIALSLAIVPILPMTLPAVCMWWLADDLMRNPQRRPATLGRVALGIFSIAAVAGVIAFLLVDAHFDCGGTLGGFGDSADARLDESCAAGQRWRAMVGAVMALGVCIVGGVAVRRSDPATVPIVVAARTFAAMIAAIVVATLLLAFT